jgi:hypothetical protein
LHSLAGDRNQWQDAKPLRSFHFRHFFEQNRYDDVCSHNTSCHTCAILLRMGRMMARRGFEACKRSGIDAHDPAPLAATDLSRGQAACAYYEYAQNTCYRRAKQRIVTKRVPFGELDGFSNYTPTHGLTESAESFPSRRLSFSAGFLGFRQSPTPRVLCRFGASATWAALGPNSRQNSRLSG